MLRKKIFDRRPRHEGEAEARRTNCPQCGSALVATQERLEAHSSCVRCSYGRAESQQPFMQAILLYPLR